MSLDQASITAFIENSADSAIFDNVAKQLNLKNYEVIEGGVRNAIELYQEKKSPDYLVVDISKSDLPSSDITRLFEVCSPNVTIVVIGTKNEVSLYRDLTKLGIYEYLLSPLFPEILETTLQSIMTGKSKTEVAPTKTGKIIACMGARGGVGATFLASNVAAMLAGEKLRRVVLIDLDPYFGTFSLNFDLKENIHLKEAFENPGRIDQILIERLLTPINERLYIFGSEESLSVKVDYNIEGLDEIIKYLKKQFHYIIIDIPHTFNDTVSKIIKKSNIFLFITEPTVAGLRDTGRLLQFVNKEVTSHRCIVILNKNGQYGEFDVDVGEFAKILKNKVDHIIPYDTKISIEFLNQGKTMENEKNRIANSIRNIMFDILGTPQVQQKKSWFKKLF